MTLDDVFNQLKELNDTSKKQLEIAGLGFALEPLRYIARKLRTGEAKQATSAYYQAVVAGGTFALTLGNSPGYVFLPVVQSIEVSQNAVFEFTAFLDDAIIPSLYIPRLVTNEIHWTQVLPFGFIMKETGLVTFVNHDIATQWVSVVSFGVQLRKEVWERESKLMDVIAERYVHPAVAPMPRRA